MTRHFRIASPDEAAPVSITAAPDTESVVDRALTMLGAALRPNAVDTYLPTRILDTLRMLHESGMAQAHRARVTATTARMEIAAAFAQPSPAEIPPPDEAAIAETLRSVQRHTLNMSVPPPNRHVAYLTHQLRRAFAEAYQHGWNAGRCLHRCRKQSDAVCNAAAQSMSGRAGGILRYRILALPGRKRRIPARHGRRNRGSGRRI